MLKTTPLTALPRAAGGRVVDLGGWDMPVNYGSQIEEHHAVRTDAGMFDVSHMQVVDLEGSGVRAFLRRALANNVDKLQVPGKALYSCMLTEQGGVVDDLIVYFFRENDFRLVVNAGTAEKDVAWLEGLVGRWGLAVRLAPRRDLAMIAIQGPNARSIFWQAFPAAKAATEGLAPFNAAMTGDLIVARTGYTREDRLEGLVGAAKPHPPRPALAPSGPRPAGP